MLTISGGQHIKTNGIEKNGQITIDKGQITLLSVGEKSKNHLKLADTDMVFPGFIDLHVHGGGGSDVMEDTEESLKNISTHLARYGVTGWLATTYSSPVVDMADIGAAASWLLGTKDLGAEILGVHHEGPFLSQENRGVHPEGSLLKPSLSQLEELIAPAAVAMVTLAPELAESLKLIDLIKERNIIPSIGHTAASFEQMEEAINHGARYLVHAFNGMSPFHHRSPQAIGAALIRDEIIVEVIADLIHLHPATIELIIKTKGPDRITLASDAISAAGMGDGVYSLSGQQIQVKAGAVRLENQQLAGSVLTLDQAVKNLVKTVGINISDVAKMASSTPAKVLSLEMKKGQITENYDADLTILDQSFQVLYTIVGGNIVYQRDIPQMKKTEKEIKEEAERELNEFLKQE